MLACKDNISAMQRTEQWLEHSFRSAESLPFSFVYGGKRSSEILKDCDLEKALVERTQKGEEIRSWYRYKLDENMVCEVELIHYTDFPVAEWVCWFENTGVQNTEILENVKSMNVKVEYPSFRKAGTMQFGSMDNVLTYYGGSDCKIDDFIPCQEVLHHISRQEHMHFGCRNGRPTSGSHGALPYFNLRTRNCGAILALGWGGQWEMDMFTRRRTNDNCFTFEGGMEDTYLYLKPGERIRTPLAVLMPWVGDQEESQNIFRRYVRKYHSPRVNGEIVRMPATAGDWGTNEKELLLHLDEIEQAKKAGWPLEVFWVDAGWYGPEGNHCDDPLCDDCFNYVGYFDHDERRFPNGLKPISDRAHALGMKFLLWLEHEHCWCGTPPTTEHPEFFLGHRVEGEPLLFNMGHPEAWKWMFDMLSTRIERYGIDILRVDHNENPLAEWGLGDEENRRGMTQIQCVMGLWKLWDILRERFPNLIIDNCASGGRRLDIESLSRSVSLFRSDYPCYADSDAVGYQVSTCSLSQWVPVSTISGKMDTHYRFRSLLEQGFNFGIADIEAALSDPERMSQLQGWFKEYETVRDLFTKDLYVLSNVSISQKDWCAFELYSPEEQRGAVLSFRRELCPCDSATYRLKGLDADTVYEVQDMDTGRKIIKTGGELAENGVSVHIGQTCGSSLVLFEKAE